MKIYGRKNVFDAALARIRWIFDEFPNVICNVSGGKDSTVIFNLMLQVAREKNRLPLKCMFVDQEAEWQATIDQIRLIMEHPDVEPMWFQVPIRLFNATSTQEHWLHCWDEAEKERWMRPQEEYSYKVNKYGTDRFVKLFDAILAHEFHDTKTCNVAGVRTEESPVRALGLTTAITYKYVTWGRIVNKKLGHYNLYPIYDWSYIDVWKAIQDNGWHYNAIYDAQYRYGIPIKDMRVSNVHHETALGSLFYAQEVEPETYVKLTQRISGIDMAAKMGDDDYYVNELPPMFSSWPEYRDYLLEKLITDPKWRAGMKSRFDKMQVMYGEAPFVQKMYKEQINSILANDWECIKVGNFEGRQETYDYRQKMKGRGWYAKDN